MWKTAKSFDDPPVRRCVACPHFVAKLLDHRLRQHLILAILAMLEGQIQEILFLPIFQLRLKALRDGGSRKPPRDGIGGKGPRIGPEEISRKLVQNDYSRESRSRRANLKAVMFYELSVQVQEAIANLRVSLGVFGKPVSFPKLFEPEVYDVADPGRLDTFCFRGQFEQCQSGSPAIRIDSARLAASAGFLNGCFDIRCPIENSGFRAKHSAARARARSTSSRRA